MDASENVLEKFKTRISATTRESANGNTSKATLRAVAVAQALEDILLQQALYKIEVL